MEALNCRVLANGVDLKRGHNMAISDRSGACYRVTHVGSQCLLLSIFSDLPVQSLADDIQPKNRTCLDVFLHSAEVLD